jgi:hypothetical protein
MQLNDQVKRLQSTEYEFGSKEFFVHSIQKIRSSILQTFLPSILFIVLIILLVLVDTVFTIFVYNLITISIVVIGGFSLTSILIGWYYQKQTYKRKVDLEEEIDELPIFPDL